MEISELKTEKTTLGQESIVSARRGHYCSVESFIKAGVNLDERNHEGKTALDKAKENDHIGLVRLISGYKLIVAAGAHDLKLVEELLPDVTDFTLENEYGETALMCALANKCEKSIKLISRYKFAIERIGETVMGQEFIVASRKGFFYTVENFLKAGVNLDERNYEEKTGLDKAIEMGHTDIVGLISSYKLLMTVESKDFEMAKELLPDVTDFILKNKKGETALVMAMDIKNYEIARMIGHAKKEYSWKMRILNKTSLVK